MKLTIITVVKNGESHIAKCLDSVFKYSSDDVEHLTVYSNSSDNTLNLCKNYPTKIIFQDGVGIYDAMNLGISYSNGDYILFLNSDDYLLQNSISQILDVIDYTYPIYAFSIILKSKFSSKLWVPNETFNLQYQMPLPHPGLIVSRSILCKYLFNINYKYSSDYDLVLKLLNFNIRFLSTPIIVFNTGGASSNFVAIFENLLIRSSHNFSLKFLFVGFIHDCYRFIANKFYFLK